MENIILVKHTKEDLIYPSPKEQVSCVEYNKNVKPNKDISY